MKIKHLFLLLLSAPLMWSCGDDDVVTPTPDPSAKVDQPHSIIGNQALPYAQRMEVPAIKDPTMYVVHYTDYNGKEIAYSAANGEPFEVVQSETETASASSSAASIGSVRFA